MSNGKVSIIIPTYNSAQTIGRAINSVRKQSYVDWEALIIDDASSDRTQSEVSKYENLDKRIKYIRLTENVGPGGARNVGIEHSIGQFIAFLDSDDEWHSDKLTLQMLLIQARSAKLCICPYQVVRKNETEASYTRSPPKELTYKNLLKTNFIGCSTAVYGKKYFDELRFIDPTALVPKNLFGKLLLWLCNGRIFHEDYIFWLTLVSQLPPEDSNDFACADRARAVYHETSSSISSTKWRAAIYQMVVYRYFLGASWPRSFLWFVAYAVNGLLKRRSH